MKIRTDPARWAAFFCGCFAVFALSGCKKEERMDTAMMKGAQAGAKAIELKANGQKRVDDATAILDGK
jgi:hypothetical protein